MKILKTKSETRQISFGSNLFSLYADSESRWKSFQRKYVSYIRFEFYRRTIVFCIRNPENILKVSNFVPIRKLKPTQKNGLEFEKKSVHSNDTEIFLNAGKNVLC